MENKFYNIYNNIIDLDGEIGNDVELKQFRDDFNAIDAEKVIVRVNSGGGEVFTGIGIYNLLKDSDKEIEVIINGYAGSIASVIAMAGDTVKMPSNAMFMIHNPLSMVYGNSSDMRKMADDLDKVKQAIQKTYEDRTNLSADELSTMMDNETWLTADEALKYGFCDEIIGGISNMENKKQTAFYSMAQEPKTTVEDLEAKFEALSSTVEELKAKVIELEKDNSEEPEKTEEEHKEEEDKPVVKNNGWSSFFNITK